MHALALLRGGQDTQLARFWPYVAGAAAAGDAETARRYSALMADSQALVAEDTLAQADLGHSRRVMDLGGGTGALAAADRPRASADRVSSGSRMPSSHSSDVEW